MSDRYVEKTFLYLLCLSVLLHVALFTAFLYLLPAPKAPVQEPQMLDLSDLIELPPAPQKRGTETKRHAEQRRRVPKETAPKGESELGRAMSKPRRAPPPLQHPLEGAARPGKTPRAAPPESARPGSGMPEEPSRERSVQSMPRGEGLFKPHPEKGQTGDIAKLFPNARSLARTEESFRKKYGAEVEEGNARFLNTDDVLFGSFLHRFENAVYGVWHYPQAAVELGEQGVTPVKITFNKRGEIEHVELLETSGSKILDREVLRTLRMIGPVGGFPRGYERETFNLIAFFHYKIGGSRSLR